jgi:hypothetical protein
VGRHRQRDAGIDPRDLLDADAVVDRRHRRAAVLFGELDAHQAERAELRHQLPRKVLVLIPLADVRTDFGFRELADRAAQQLLLVCRTKVHGLSDCSTTPRGNRRDRRDRRDRVGTPKTSRAQ